MTVATAILMKDPGEAKTRLRETLDCDAREQLALVMFENTLRFFSRRRGSEPLCVVTRSERIAAITRAHGADVVADVGVGGINGAAACASRWAGSKAAGSLLVVHADIPTLLDAEVEQLLVAGQDHAVVIARSVDGGTNAMLLSPVNAIPFCYGKNSAVAHEAMALSWGLSSRSVDLPFLSKDIDTPDDLRGFALGEITKSLHAFAVGTLPEINPGDDLAETIAAALLGSGASLLPGDIVVVAQKIVSKSEARMVRLEDYTPSERACSIAAEIGKDPRKVEAILEESSHVLRARATAADGVMITRHRQGWICANAGIDESNLGNGRDGMLLLLPEDPDRSSAQIRDGLERRFAGPIGVIVSDTFGRPWRNGLVNVAIGVAGVPAVVDWAGRGDAYGRMLKVTLPAFADEVAAAAGLLMKKDAGLPAIVVRGLQWSEESTASAQELLRPLENEMFL